MGEEAAISVRVRTLIALAATAAAVLATAAPAPAATGWRCSAGTLAGSVLGQSLPGAVTAGSTTADCTGSQASGPLSVPPLLDVGLLAASTAGDASKAIAVGGVADLRVRSLPDLGIQLPPVEIPEALLNFSVLGIPIDLRPAIDALLPDRRLPTLDLVTVTAATAYAAGQCTDGVPKLAGVPVVGDVRIGGTELADGVVERVLPLIDTKSIDLSNLDLSEANLLGLPLNIVQPALDLIVDLLPPLEIPATLAHVKVTPGDQVLTDKGVVQSALRVEASIAGQSIADLTLGQAAVAADGVDCTPPAAQPPPPDPQPDASDLALACTKRDIVLIDVLPRGRRVKLIGAADKRFAGRTVDIVFGATGRRVARALVGADGSFATTAPMPPRRLRRTNRARYRAVLGDERSLNLKLMRRMVVDSVRSSGGRVRIRGRVLPPLARPRKPIVVKRRVTCSRSQVVARVRPSRSGRFTVSVKAPANQSAAVYRLQTQVRNTPTNPRLYPTFTLPRAVDL